METFRIHPRNFLKIWVSLECVGGNICWLQNQHKISRRMMYNLYSIRLCDSYWICLCSQYFVRIHAYANTNYWGNKDKYNMNHIVLHIIRRRILHWFRIWSQKNISAHAFKRKSRLKNLHGRIQKNFDWFESGVKFWFEIYPYIMKLKVTVSRIADGKKIDYVS